MTEKSGKLEMDRERRLFQGVKPHATTVLQVETLKAKVKALKEETERLNEESAQLKASIKRAKEINKRLLLILYDQGLLNKGKSVFSLFHDVSAKLKI